ncbi:MAG: glycosyltransferase [Anaerolineae bacterium]|nr:glycosyltransferase [Anaerolineae bacterium]
MRLLYVVHQFLPDFVGGTELDTWEVATRMRDRGHDVTILHRAPGDGGLVQTSREGIPVYRMEVGPMMPRSLFSATFGHRALTRHFRGVFAETKPDLVHFQHLRGLPAGLPGWVKAQGAPAVISLRDFWFICPNAQLIDYVTGELCTTPGEPVHCARCALVRAGLRSALVAAPLLAPVMAARNRILRRVITEADVLLVYSEFVRVWFASQGAPDDRLHFVPRGIPRPEPLPARQREAHGPVRFVYVGGLAWQKGVHTVIAAFNDLPGDAELVVAGDESKYPAYVRDLRALATHPGIRFVGRLDRPAVWQALADADAVLVPSLWYETFSMLVREAFAMGLPVLASDHGVLADAVTDGVDGLLVPPGDVPAWRAALLRYVESSDLRARLKAGVQPPLTMAEYVDNLEAEYTQALAA